MGKISALARGARKSSKRFGGALEPFAVFEATFARSRHGVGSMFTISEASVLESNDSLGSNLEKLGVAGFLLELLREVAPEHDSSEALFDLGRGALHLLSTDATANPRNVLFSAGLRILAQSGLAMGVTRCTACGTAVPPNKSVFFDALRGGVVCTPCGGGPILLSAEAAGALRFFQQHTVLESASRDIDASVRTEMQSVFETFINVHLEKYLKTPLFMEQVTR